MPYVPQQLTAQTAAEALTLGLTAIEQGQREFDLGHVGAIDSAGVATLVGWQRAARARQLTLEFQHAPARLLNLAEVYGLTDLLPFIDRGR